MLVELIPSDVFCFVFFLTTHRALLAPIAFVSLQIPRVNYAV